MTSGELLVDATSNHNTFREYKTIDNSDKVLSIQKNCVY